MKNINKKSLIIIAVMLISLMIFAESQKPCMENKPEKQHCMESNPFVEIMESLTEQQKDKIHEIRMDYEKNNIDIRAEADKLELELKELMRDDNPNEKNIINMIKKISEKRTALRINDVKMGFDIMEQLTEEQKGIIDGLSLFHCFGGNPMMRKMMDHKMER